MLSEISMLIRESLEFDESSLPDAGGWDLKDESIVLSRLIPLRAALWELQTTLALSVLNGNVAASARELVSEASLATRHVERWELGLAIQRLYTIDRLMDDFINLCRGDLGLPPLPERPSEELDVLRDLDAAISKIYESSSDSD